MGWFVFERVQFEGNEVGFQVPIGPKRMLLNVKCEWESSAYLCILMIGMDECVRGEEKCVTQSARESETGERDYGERKTL